MRTILTIAGKDLRLRFRDRSAVVIAFVAPLSIAVLMSLAFSGAENFHMKLALVVLDRGPLGSALDQALSAPELKEVAGVERVSTVAAATRLVRSGDADVALVVPETFSEEATSTGGEPGAGLRVLASGDKQLAAGVTRSIADSFVARVNGNRLAVMTALRAGASPADLGRLVALSQKSSPPEQTQIRPPGFRSLHAVSYYAPGMAIFFLLFSIGFGARGWFIEQSTGTLERMGALVHPTSILIGKALSVAVYGTASLATMIVVTTVALGADWGGPLPAAALGAAMVVSIVCLTAFVILVSRTQRQAEGIAAMVTFGLAVLGGNFMFVSAAPPIMRRLALLTPNGWAMRGYMDLATGPHTLATIVQPLLAIAAFCAVTAAVVGVLARRSL